MRLKILDITALVDDGKQRLRDIDAIDRIAVHRVGRILNKKGGLISSIGSTAEEICDAFLNNPAVAKYTGSQIPYTLIIEESGCIKQCLPIDDIGAHARRWNRAALGVALVGDFRYEKPTLGQEFALIDTLKLLCRAFALDPLQDIYGHTELPEATASKDKHCPGEMLDMGTLKDAVFREMRDSARLELESSGLAWMTEEKNNV